jgi:hypothetical protein
LAREECFRERGVNVEREVGPLQIVAATLLSVAALNY